MPALEAERFDVRSDRFGDAQPVERKQADECVILCSAETGGDEHGTDFVAVQPGGVRFVVESRTAHVHGRRLGDEVFFFGVAVEARHRAEPAGDRRASSTE